MDFKTQGEAIANQKREAWEGFQKTIQLGKMYSEEDMEIKSNWVKKIEAVNDELGLWLNSIPKKDSDIIKNNCK
ncbi:hypothetical protein SCM21_00390 [Legionella pneumophila serogroup 1]